VFSRLLKRLGCAMRLSLAVIGGLLCMPGLATILALPAAAKDRPCALGHPCSLAGPDGGTYYLAFPANWDGKEPLKPFVFFHGHNGSGAGEIRNRTLVQGVTTRGYLMISPDGPLFDFRGRSVRGWAARPEGANPRGKRNDIRFVERVLADVATRVPVVPNDTVVSGFSSGGSMAWYFSCYSKLRLAGVYAVSGALRRPLPQPGVKQADGSIAKTCPGGARKLIHLHGYADRTVPLEGRGIGNWHQGDVFEGLAVQRASNQCGSRPDEITVSGTFWCRTWADCGSGKPVRFCLHAGGHGIPHGWVALGLDWLAGPHLISGR
jgi:polyhydroxybutyrate depolymerase